MSIISFLKDKVFNEVSEIAHGIGSGISSISKSFTPKIDSYGGKNLSYKAMEFISKPPQIEAPKFRVTNPNIAQKAATFVPNALSDIGTYTLNTPSRSFEAAAQIPVSRNPRELIGNIAGAAELPLMFLPLGAGFKGLGAASKTPLLKQVGRRALEGFATSFPFGFSSGLAANKDADSLKSQFSSALGSGALAGLGGAALLGSTPIVARLGNKIINITGETLNNPQVQKLLKSEKGFFTVPHPKGKYLKVEDLISHEGAPDKLRVGYFMEKFKKGFPLEPIYVTKEGNKWGIIDGKHRFEAYKLLGIKDIPVIELNPINKIKKLLSSETGAVRLGAEETIKKADDTTPVGRVLNALYEAKSLRGEQTVLNKAARKEQFAKGIEARLAAGEGEQGYYAQLASMKGSYPKQVFEEIRSKLNQEDADAMYNQISRFPDFGEGEKLSTFNGLTKLFQGEIPEPAELNNLETVFGSDLVKALTDKQPLINKFVNLGADLINSQRSLVTSMDFSASLRQALFLGLRHPKAFAKAFAGQFKEFASEDAFQASQKIIKQHKNFDLLVKDGGLAITDLDRNLLNREEAFQSALIEKVPFIGQLVRGSGRAYTGLLNKLRFDAANDLLVKSEMAGIKPTRKFITDLTGFVNAASGRGGLGALESSTKALSASLFSPRYWSSRLKLMNPQYYANPSISPFVRMEAFKSALTFVSTGLSVLGLASLAGAKVGTNPTSSDFGKIKIGNTRLDIWAGFQQNASLIARLLTGKITSSTTGKVYPIKSILHPNVKGYKPTTDFDLLLRVLEQKSSPLVSFAIDALKGTDFTGKPLNIKEKDLLNNPVAQRFIPLVFADLFELLKDQGVQGLFLAPLPIFGVGTQTYDTKAPENRFTPFSNPKGTPTTSVVPSRYGADYYVPPPFTTNK